MSAAADPRRTTEVPSSPGRLRGEVVIAVAIGLMNLSTYAYTLVAARTLGPRPYGAFAALMATLLVLGVLQLGLQATAARRIAADPRHVAQIERNVLSFTYRTALALAVLTALLAPLLSVLLRIDVTATLLVALTIAPLTVMGGQAGVLQGERRWAALAAVYLAAGVPRLLIGTALLVTRPTETTAMWGVALAAFIPVALAAAILRRSSAARQAPTWEPSQHHELALIGAETMRNSWALLAFFALSNADVIVARVVLDGHDAGLYAGGLILTKAVLFLPQFVVVVAFPSMSADGGRGRALLLSLGLIGAMGAAVVGGVRVLPTLAQSFVGGAEYAEIADRLWLFAVLGTALAALQVLVYAVLARQGRRSVYALWAALALIVAAGVSADSPTELLLRVLTLDLVLLATLLLAALRTTSSPAAPSVALSGGTGLPTT